MFNGAYPKHLCLIFFGYFPVVIRILDQTYFTSLENSSSTTPLDERISPLYVCDFHFVGDKTNCELILIFCKVSQFSRLVEVPINFHGNNESIYFSVNLNWCCWVVIQSINCEQIRIFYFIL